MRITVAAAAAFLLSAVAAHAAPIGDTYVIPAVAHVQGANGETWTSDVFVHNISATTIVIELTAVTSTGELVAVEPGTVTVAPRGTLALRDVMQRAGIVGALLVTGNAPFAITSRTHAGGVLGTVGQSVAAASDFMDAASFVGFLPGLVANVQYRTNIGFFAVADKTDLLLEISLIDGSGIVLGTRSFGVPAGRLAHLQVSSRDIAPVAFDAASAHVRVVSGDGAATAYASVIDNVSNDGNFIPVAVPADSSASQNLLRQRALTARRAGGGR